MCFNCEKGWKWTERIIIIHFTFYFFIFITIQESWSNLKFLIAHFFWNLPLKFNELKSRIIEILFGFYGYIRLFLLVEWYNNYANISQRCMRVSCDRKSSMWQTSRIWICCNCAFETFNTKFDWLLLTIQCRQNI